MVPVMAWALVIPATVKVPDEAVIDPADATIDEVEVSPAAENVVCAVIASELVIPATLRLPELAVIDPADTVSEADDITPAEASVDDAVTALLLVIPATVSVDAGTHCANNQGR